MVSAYVAGCLVLTGGPVSATASPLYGQILPFPVFEPPHWLTISLAAMGAAAFVPMATLVQPSETQRIVAALRFTAGGNIMGPLVYMGAFPDYVDQDSWLEPGRRGPQRALDHPRHRHRHLPAHPRLQLARNPGTRPAPRAADGESPMTIPWEERAVEQTGTPWNAAELLVVKP